MRSKKSMGIQWYSILIGFILGAFAYYTVSPEFTLDHFVGYYSFQLKKAANNAENLDFYITKSAENSIAQATMHLSQSGGNPRSNEISDVHYRQGCGTFQGSEIWFQLKNSDGEEISISDCLPEQEIGANFEDNFRQYFESYMKIHPGNIVSGAFTYEILDDSIIIKSKDTKEFDIMRSDAIENKELRSNFDTAPVLKNGKADFTKTQICPSGEECVLSGEAHTLLEKAQAEAQKKGVSIELVDGYRTVEEQKYLWNKWAAKVPNESERRKYVCYPYGDDVQQRCPHLSGNAVDVRLAGKPMSASDWQMLEDIMTGAGWVRYSQERWHFECCNTPRYARARQQGTDVVA
jgi:D-alanyl-D-alanine dipeptidase